MPFSVVIFPFVLFASHFLCSFDFPMRTLQLSGICLLGLGIWILVDESVVNTFNIFRVIQDGEHLLSYAAYILIVVGIFIVFVVVVGHFGILRESKVLLGLVRFPSASILPQIHPDEEWRGSTVGQC